jgi:hypothetical protein
VINGKDEGMLMYVQAQRFMRADEALAMWRFKRLDWLVLGEGDFTKYRAALEPFDLVASTPVLPEKFNSYRLLHRAEPKSAPALVPFSTPGGLVIPPVPDQPKPAKTTLPSTDWQPPKEFAR